MKSLTMMLFPTALLLFTLQVREAIAQDVQFQSNDQTSHIVLLGSTRPDGTRDFRCGGSYLGRNVVVAGAHCVSGKSQPTLDTVRFGSGTDNVMHFRIVNHTLHYRYKPQFEYHNMAVYFLDARPDVTGAGSFKPACILKPHMKQGTVQMVGDGSNGRGLSLQTTSLDVVASEKCHEYYNPIPKLRFGVLLCCFCAMNSDTTECSNMHSSPLQLVINRNGKRVPFLIGHKSIGKACGVKSPAVFTRYGSYYEWLETITNLPLEATGVLLIMFGSFFCVVHNRIQPAERVFPTDINKAFIPTVRQTLNDCHLRYHKVAPQVVRLGVIDITAGLYDPQNQFAQEYSIASFRRHPEHEFRTEYHDIALVTLDRAVTLTSAVVPACLWTGAQVPVRRLEAAGFGQTSFGGDRTPILLKVQLSPVEIGACSRFYPPGRRRRQGLIEQQLCAADERMDTCHGDSGGPLQIKLMANNRLIPFVAGITSFGRFCGTGTPAVYTRVSSYVDWIQTETGQSFDARACAARHINEREIEEAMIANRAGDKLFVEPEKSYMDLETVAKHRVYLGYSNANGRIQWNCGGVLINENYVLTVAHCDRFILNKTPDYVKAGDLDIFKDHPQAQIVQIEQFIKHPDYQSLTLPFYEMAGLGPYNMNNFIMDNEPLSNNNTLVLTRMRADSSVCSWQSTNKIMCTRNNQSLVPGTCRIEHGGPLEREIWHHDRYYSYVFGLTVAGDDCGFESEASYVNIASHIRWIEQTVLGNSNRRRQFRSTRTKRQILFPNSGEYIASYAVVQSCQLPDGRRGSCKPYSSCTSGLMGTTVSICQHGIEPIVCCATATTSTTSTNTLTRPTRLSAGGSGYKLNGCVSYWKQYKRPPIEEFEHIPSEGRPVGAEEYPHIAAIGNSQQNVWPCTGVLVSDRYVMSAASCLASGRGLRSIQLGFGAGSPNVFEIDEIINHPSYGRRMKDNYNLALVRLKNTVRFSSSILPACLWTKSDMVPLKLYSVGRGADGQMQVYPRSAMYNADCRALPSGDNSIMDAENVCIENYYSTDTVCPDLAGNPVEGIVDYNGTRIPLIVGTTSYTGGCLASAKTQTIAILSRIAVHMTWIKGVVER
uniref:Peptidase S1 domain-containing protein n=1 Tax=Anopheles minimus TaxID=112268 RepID=A0A182WMK8_9DIPT